MRLNTIRRPLLEWMGITAQIEPENIWPSYDDTIVTDTKAIYDQVKYFADMYQDGKIDAASAVAGLKSFLPALHKPELRGMVTNLISAIIISHVKDGLADNTIDVKQAIKDLTYARNNATHDKLVRGVDRLLNDLSFKVTV